ncbi:hypothetical protein GOP47_0008845 [Adiantum capillus-veneris]|uniref:Uncharacterized protein n=1 Tax=Adiantum capillus-veneris TaxID=13818 RepID=A0A9D4ZL39_ADICA|nr:hypothetical protein GOP47_0008845 [Adiantum capillus-veneris]
MGGRGRESRSLGGAGGGRGNVGARRSVCSLHSGGGEGGCAWNEGVGVRAGRQTAALHETGDGVQHEAGVAFEGLDVEPHHEPHPLHGWPAVAIRALPVPPQARLPSERLPHPLARGRPQVRALRCRLTQHALALASFPHPPTGSSVFGKPSTSAQASAPAKKASSHLPSKHAEGAAGENMFATNVL